MSLTKQELDNARIHEREIIRQHGSVEIQEKVLKSAEANLKMRNGEYDKIKRRYEELEKGPMRSINSMCQVGCCEASNWQRFSMSCS